MLVTSIIIIIISKDYLDFAFLREPGHSKMRSPFFMVTLYWNLWFLAYNIGHSVLCFHWWQRSVLFVCGFASTTLLGRLHSRFSYMSIEFHKYTSCVNIVLNIRYGMLVESNHIIERRQMALDHWFIGSCCDNQ